MNKQNKQNPDGNGNANQKEGSDKLQNINNNQNNNNGKQHWKGRNNPKKNPGKPNWDKNTDGRNHSSSNNNNNSNSQNQFKVTDFTEKLPNRSVQASSEKNNHQFSTTNFSTEMVCKKHWNSSFLTTNVRDIQDVTITIKLTVAPIIKRLEAQANVWASKIYATPEIIHRYIVGSNESLWMSRYEELYIYSYFRGLLYGVFHTSVGDIKPSNMSLIGHCLLRLILSSPAFTFEHRGMRVKYVIEITQSDIDTIVNQAKKYPYIANYLINQTNRFSLENPDLDRRLNTLALSLTGDDPKFESLFDLNGRVRTHLTKDNFPIGNSFYCKNNINVSSFRYAFKEGESIISMSTLFGKANFFKSRNDNTVDSYFDLSNVDDKYTLTKYEVMCIAGCMYGDYIDVAK